MSLDLISMLLPGGRRVNTLRVMNSFRKDWFLTFLTQILAFLFSFLGSVVLARFLGPEMRGNFALILLIVSTSGLLGTLGIDIANVYFSANKKYDLSDIVSNTYFSSAVVGTTIILFFFGLSVTGLLRELLSETGISFWHASFAMITVPFFLFTTFSSKILLGRAKFLEFNIVIFSQASLYLLLILVSFALLNDRLLGAVVAYISSVILVSLIVFFFVRKLAPARIRLNRPLLKSSLLYGGRGFLGNLVQFLNYRLDMFLVAYFLDMAAVGYYTIAVGLAEKLWLIPGSVATVLFPKISSQDTQSKHITPKLCRMTFLFLVFLSLIFLLFSGSIVSMLFGPDFVPATTPLIILLPGVVFLGIGKILSSDLAGKGRTGIGSLAAFLSLITNLLLNLILIPKWGIAGAALASTLAYSVASGVLGISFAMIYGTSWSDFLLIRRSDITDFRLILADTLTRAHLDPRNVNPPIHRDA